MNDPTWLRSWSLLLLCNLIWASQFVMVKLVQQQMGPISATLIPMLVATFLLVPIVARERNRRSTPLPLRPRSDIWRFAMLGILGQVVAQLGITWGMRYAPASNAALLMLILPVVTAVIAYLILRERMTRIRWISFALAIPGALICSGIDWSSLTFSRDSAALGNALIMLSICGSAFYNVYSKELLTRYSPLEVLLFSYFAVLLCLIPISLALEPIRLADVLAYSATTWAGIGVLALFQYFASMIMFLLVLKSLQANQVAIGNYLIPFFGLAIAALALGERLSGYMFVGGALVLASTILATIGETRLDSQRTRSRTLMGTTE